MNGFVPMGSRCHAAKRDNTSCWRLAGQDCVGQCVCWLILVEICVDRPILSVCIVAGSRAAQVDDVLTTDFS